MKFTCPNCEQLLEVDSQIRSESVQCPSCGRYIKNPNSNGKPAPAPSRGSSPPPTSTPHITAQLRGQPQHVVITDIKLPLSSMIILMLKWFVASIPVALAIGAIYILIMLLFFGGCAALMASGMK